jgi:hypothetical protein
MINIIDTLYIYIYQLLHNEYNRSTTSYSKFIYFQIKSPAHENVWQSYIAVEIFTMKYVLKKPYTIIIA